MKGYQEDITIITNIIEVGSHVAQGGLNSQCSQGWP